MRAALRASKKLIVAIAALLASVILCIGVCLAWFATTREVDGSGMRGELSDGGIVDLDVTAYYLNADGSVYKKASTGNVNDEMGKPLEVDYNEEGILEEDETDSMRPYILNDTYATAILFEIKYELRISDSKYRIFVKCPDDSDLQVSGDGEEFSSPLSNSVFLVNATGHDVGGENENFTFDQSDAYPFVRSNENYDKYYKINCVTDIQPVANDESSYKNTVYIIMDYDPALFSYLSARMLEGGGSLTSRLVFDGDITIGIEGYDDEAAVPQSIEICNEDSVSSRFTQEQGVDVISSTWIFKVTYSDGTVRSVSKGSAGLSIDIDTVTRVGDLTAAISFTDGGETVSTEVDYTISEGAHTHQYVTEITKLPTKTATGTAVLTCAVESCDQVINLTLPVLTDSRYRITNDTATTEQGGTGTYTITVNGMTLSFTAPTDPLPEEEIAVTNIIINPTSAELLVGDTQAFTATVYPANATDKTVTWSTNRSSVATVDENGVVTARGVGSAVITASAGGVNQTCTVTVGTPVVNVTGVTLNKTTTTLTVGGTETLTATVAPADATDKSVTWSTSKASVATVSNGKITAVSAGTATITVTTTDGSKTATCTVTVEEAVVSVTGVTLNKTSTTLTVGDTETLTATVAPAGATDKSVSWSTSKASVATVDANGKITAVGAGTATITVTTTDGSKTATCTVTVEEAVVNVTGVTLNKTSTTLTVGGTETLTATVAPAGATDKSVTWKSSKTGVATVDANGKITAVAAGTATITVTTTDGSKTATCTVTVTDGGSETVSGSLAPTETTNSNITALASDDNIAVTASSGTRANELSDGTIAWVTRSNSTTVSIANNSSSALTVTVYLYASSDNNGSSLTATTATFGSESGTTSETEAIALTVEIAAGETATLATGNARIVLTKVEYETA